MDSRYLVVSFHDLHPGTMACCIRFLERLKAMGVPRVSLLTVPNWYYQSPLTDHPEFCVWLRDQPHDISLHGYAHIAGHRPEKPFEWLMANKYTAGEGEFYKLSLPEADMLIFQGLEIFRKAGIRANGFIAPAWLMQDEHIPLIGKVGLDYCVTYKKIYDMNRLQIHRAPVLCTTSRTPLRRALTRPVISMLDRKHRREPILRMAVHPVDFQYPAIEEFIYRLIARALESRTPATYAEIVNEASIRIGQNQAIIRMKRGWKTRLRRTHEFPERGGKDGAAEKQVEVVGEHAPQ